MIITTTIVDLIPFFGAEKLPSFANYSHGEENKSSVSEKVGLTKPKEHNIHLNFWESKFLHSSIFSRVLVYAFLDALFL